MVGDGVEVVTAACAEGERSVMEEERKESVELQQSCYGLRVKAPLKSTLVPH